MAPVTCAFVIGFIIWTHVTASSAFFLNVIELLAIVAAVAAVWRSMPAATASRSPRLRDDSGLHPAIFVDLYPNVMVSSTSPAYNLTVHNTASAPYSLKAMTVVVVMFLPLVLAYQAWTYYVFRRRVSASPSSSPRRSRARCQARTARQQHLKPLPRLAARERDGTRRPHK